LTFLFRYIIFGIIAGNMGAYNSVLDDSVALSEQARRFLPSFTTTWRKIQLS